MPKAGGGTSHSIFHLQEENDSTIEAMEIEEGGVVLEEGGGCVLLVDRASVDP